MSRSVDAITSHVRLSATSPTPATAQAPDGARGAVLTVKTNEVPPGTPAMAYGRHMLRGLIAAFSQHRSQDEPVRLRGAGGDGESVPPEPPQRGGGDPTVAEDDRGASAALRLLQDLADQEFTRAERAASRARQAFALAAGFYAVVQTVAFGSFAKGLVSGGERHALLWLAGSAGALLAVCGALLLIADAAYRSSNIRTDTILNVLNDESDDGTTAEERFVEYYATVVDEMRETNRRRHRVVIATQLAALSSLALVLAELIYSLDARLS
jgi:hypothetical protein